MNSEHLSRETLVVTKKEIVKAISEELGLTQLKTKEIVQKTFDAIVETLVADGRIELRNFGVFEVKKRAARKARNPRTGGQVEVPAKFVVTFKPGKEMEARVLQMEAEEFAREQAAKAAASGLPSSNGSSSAYGAASAFPGQPGSTSGFPERPGMNSSGSGGYSGEFVYRPPAGPSPTGPGN